MHEVPPIHVAAFSDLDTRTLHDILHLRCDVFVVEQACAYDDIDGLDADPSTRHLWIRDEAGVVAALRILRDARGGDTIGRVVTHARYRGRGLASALMRRAIAIAAPPVELRAQAHLTAWYETFGFRPCGDPFDEYGILHQAMRLEPSR